MNRPASSKTRERQFRAGKVVAPPSNGQAKAAKVSKNKYLGEYARWLKPYRGSIVSLFVIATVCAFLDKVWPMVIKFAIDELTAILAGPGSHNLHRFNELCLLMLGVIVIKQALDSHRSYQTDVLNSKVTFRLRKRLFRRLIGLPLGELGEMKAGGITSRLSGDVDNASGLVQMALLSPGVATINVLFTIIVLTWLNWRLAAATLIATPFLALSSYFWVRRVRPIYRSIREDRSEIDGRVTETFGGIRVVRSFRREPREELSYAIGHHSTIRKTLYASRLELVLSTVWGVLIPSIVIFIVWYGGHLVVRGLATVSQLFVFQIYAMMLLQPIWQIVSSISQTQRALAAMERVFDVLNKPLDKPDAPDAVGAPTVVQEMRFDHVRFEYRSETPVIRDFTLQVPGGSIVALVGPSGAGKTTLTDLVARFHDPTSGRISLNGIDLRQMRLREYRRLLAVVQQEVFLFDGTIADNIAYGRRHITAANIEDAARRANAHEFIVKLPEAYDTLIGERGFKLSGGQRQRLSIARAILADPQILILDEATSNLDTESEQLIQASLAGLFKGRTTFVIAHRLSTVTHADIIVAMEHGQIIEVGNHTELMAKQGFYHAMVERQWRSFAPADAPISS